MSEKTSTIKNVMSNLLNKPATALQRSGMSRAVMRIFEIYKGTTAEELITHLIDRGYAIPTWLTTMLGNYMPNHPLPTAARAELVYKAMLNDLRMNDLDAENPSEPKPERTMLDVSSCQGRLLMRRTGSWHGIGVGEYRTPFTPEGVDVMSLVEFGAVHVEPLGNLVPWDGEYTMDPRAVKLIELAKNGETTVSAEDIVGVRNESGNDSTSLPCGEHRTLPNKW